MKLNRSREFELSGQVHVYQGITKLSKSVKLGSAVAGVCLLSRLRCAADVAAFGGEAWMPVS